MESNGIECKREWVGCGQRRVSSIRQGTYQKQLDVAYTRKAVVAIAPSGTRGSALHFRMVFSINVSFLSLILVEICLIAS